MEHIVQPYCLKTRTHLKKNHLDNVLTEKKNQGTSPGYKSLVHKFNIAKTLGFLSVIPLVFLL